MEEGIERKVVSKEEFMTFEQRIKEIGKAVLDLVNDMGVSLIINGMNPENDPETSNVCFSFYPGNYHSVHYDDIACSWIRESGGWKFINKEENKDGE
jgi:hypothetical protein